MGVRGKLIILIFLSGCTTVSPRVDGLYINNKLVKEGASVEDYFKAQGKRVLHRGNHDILVGR